MYTPYGRLLGSEAGSKEGSAGKLGDRTELFALSSLLYYINYGVEIYDDQDQDLGEDHELVTVERLQRMISPKRYRPSPFLWLFERFPDDPLRP
jgi:hypothetical protein